MRVVVPVLCLMVGGALGWIAGNLYPAPESLHRLIDRLPAGPPWQGAVPQTSEAPSAPVAPAPAGAVDEATLKQYRAWISEARSKHPYPDSEEKMFAVMICESKGQAGTVNPAGPYSGLFQYGKSSWQGAWNLYRDQNILDPKAQIFATALAWQNHMQGQWGCYKQNH